MNPEFWIQLLTTNNIMVAAIMAEGFFIVYMARYIQKLVDKVIVVSSKSAEVLERISNDYRTKKD